MKHEFNLLNYGRTNYKQCTFPLLFVPYAYGESALIHRSISTQRQHVAFFQSSSAFELLFQMQTNMLRKEKRHMLDAADDHLNLFEWNLIFLSQNQENYIHSIISVTSIRQITVHQIRPKTQHKHHTHHLHPPFLSTLCLVFFFFNITICDIFCIDIQISTELWVDLDEIHQLFIHGAYYIQCFASLPSGLSLDQ